MSPHKILPPPSTEIQLTLTLTETPSPTPSETPTLIPTETPFAPPIIAETPLPIASPTLPELPAPVIATVEPLETVTPTMTAPVLPTATTAPESSFILGYYDDFESGELDAWLPGIGWSFVLNEIGQVFQVTGSDEPLTMNIGDSYSDFVMDVRVALDSGAAKINIRQSDAGAYSVILDANGQITLYRNDTLLGTGTAAVPITGEWHDVRVSAIGASLQILIDGTAIIVVEDASLLPAGTISFATIGGGTLRIDNFVIWLYGQNPPLEIEPEVMQAQAVQYNYATTVEQQIGVVNPSSSLGTVNGSVAQLSDGDCLIVGFSGTVTNGAISLYLGNVSGGTVDRRQIRISVSDQLLPCNSASWQQTAYIDNNSWAGSPFQWRSAGSFSGSRRYIQILTYKNMQLDSIRIYSDFATPTPIPLDTNCSNSTLDVISQSSYQSVGRTFEMADMRMGATAGGLYLHGDPIINGRRSDTNLVAWGTNIRILYRKEWLQSVENDQLWYEIGNSSGQSLGWILARFENRIYVAGVTSTSDPCDGIVSDKTQLTLGYDRRVAANYAIEHSYQNDGLSNPLAGNRVTRRLTSQSGVLPVPFANFYYSYLSGAAGATGSAVFVSEAVWIGGMPMTEGLTDSCSNPSAGNNSGWRYCWGNQGASNPWDDHRHLVAYFTNSNLPNYSITNDVLMQSGYPNNTGVQFNFPGSGTRFDNRIASFRDGGASDLASYLNLTAGLVTNATGLATFVSSEFNASGRQLQLGDYMYINPLNQDDHGLLVVGWGPILPCADAIAARFNIDSFEPIYTTTVNQIVPYVADFTRAQSPVPRPFYCTMYLEPGGLVNFAVHDWYFYTIPNQITLSISKIYVDPNWQWENTNGVYPN